MSKDIMLRLREPFQSEEVEWRIQQSGVYQDKPWAKVLAYIQARAIQNRLDEIFGFDGWQTEYRVESSGIICRLSVKVGADWVYKEDGAQITDIEPFKGGISDAFKRVAASGYGIGRYLYKLTVTFADCQFVKKDGWNKDKVKDGQANKVFYWNSPELPAWALPKKGGA